MDGHIQSDRAGLKPPILQGYPAVCILRIMSQQQYLNHHLECPYCLTIRLRIPHDAQPETPIVCDDCGEYLGTWDELLTDFEKQGGNSGVFRLEKGRIKRVD
jgi:hypothetical protein